MNENQAKVVNSLKSVDIVPLIVKTIEKISQLIDSIQKQTGVLSRLKPSITTTDVMGGLDGGDTRISYNQVLGGENGDIIPANQNYADSIVIKNDLGFDVHCYGLQVRYQNGLEDCNLKIKDSNKYEILSGNIALSQVGNNYQAAVPRDELPIDIVLKAGTDFVIQIRTRSTAVQPGQINITVFGKRK